MGTDLEWRPLARTTLTVLADREFADTSTVGQFAINRATVEGGVNQAFTDKLGVDLSYKWIQDDFVSSTREDITQTVTAGADYRIIRWFSLGFQYEYEEKSSSVLANEYDLQRFILKFNLSL